MRPDRGVSYGPPGAESIASGPGEQGGTVIERLRNQGDGEGLGGGAHRLAWLIANGRHVPETWVVPPDAPAGSVTAALTGRFDEGTRFEVRASTVDERDRPGQPAAELGLPLGAIDAAVERLRSAGSVPGGEMDVAVIVQPMVAARVSGIAFSRNPITGLNEVIIEAVAGGGDRLGDDTVVPERWTHRWGDWTARPASNALPEEIALAVAGETRRIASDYGSPVEVAFGWDGHGLWWTRLETISDIENVSVYSNRIAREVLPGVIKPLVWSVNVPMVNRAWVELFTRFLGPNDIEPRGLARSFAYRAYFNMQTIGDVFEMAGMPRDSLELLLGLPAGSEQPRFKPTAGTFRRTPRMIGAAVSSLRFARRVEAEVTDIVDAQRQFAATNLTRRADEDLLQDVETLIRLGTRAAYANIVIPLFANAYHALLRRRIARAGIDAATLDLGIRTAELETINPIAHLDRLAESVGALDATRLEEMRDAGYAGLPESLQRDVEVFMERFGHLSASGNDFSVTPWRETPDLVARMVLDHVPTTGNAPRTSWEEARRRLGPLRRVLTGRLRRRTSVYLHRRELVSLTYTQGIGLLRSHFVEIGSRLAQRGAIDCMDDVWYLYLDEVQAALLGRTHDAPPSQVVAERRAEIEAVADLELPDLIYGDDFVPASAVAGGPTMRGIPTSRGRHRGTLRVVRDMADFPKVDPGDIIAIPHSDVAWNPLFARAGAVVAESGGMLSHSSIVAREYGIPCVVSVAGATRLPDGVRALVDGYAGTVTIEEA